MFRNLGETSLTRFLILIKTNYSFRRPEFELSVQKLANAPFIAEKPIRLAAEAK